MYKIFLLKILTEYIFKGNYLNFPYKDIFILLLLYNHLIN